MNSFSFIPVVGLASTLSLVFLSSAQAETPRAAAASSDIQHLQDLERPLTQASGLWAQQPDRPSAIQVTGVRIEPTATGIEVILETAEDATFQPEIRSEANTFIAEIPNAILALPAEQEFQAEAPATGIQSVVVSSLEGNRLEVRVVGESSVPVVEVRSELSPTATETETETEEPEGDEEEIIATGEQAGSRYYNPNASTATRTNTPLRDIPQSIQVIPRQVLEDQQVTELPEAVRNAPGVVRSFGYGGSNDSFTIRGFQADTNLRNGFRDEGYYTYTDPATIERIEVLKGPVSVLYGQFEPGGVVNYITKQPLSEPYYAAQFSVGSYDFYRPTLDLSGPLNADKTALYRLNVGYRNSGSFRDFVDEEVFVAAPVFTFKSEDNRAAVTVEYEYLHLDRVFDRGLPPVKQSFDLPIERFLGERSDNYDFDSDKLRTVFDFQLSDNWQFRTAFSGTFLESTRSNAQPRTFRLEADEETLRRRYTLVDDFTNIYAIQSDLIGKFNTGPIGHQLLFGFDFTKRQTGYNFLRSNFPSINIFDPEYGFDVPDTFSEGFANEQTTDSWGIYLQDQITLLPNLKLLLGGRVDFINYESEDVSDVFGSDPPTETDRYYDAFSPRIGIVYQPIKELSLYASYSRSFKPNFSALTVDRNPLEPERGTQYEVGVKAELFGGRLATTLAAYTITKSNVATPDPDDPEFSIAAGEVKSRGIEFDLAGQLAPGWNIIASYAYNDAFVSEDTSLPEGDRLVNAAEHSASLWTTYEIQKGSLQGLGFGAGLFFVGDREAELPNALTVPSYVRADATIFYRQKNWRVGLNFKNISNTKYYDTQGFLLYPGAPFTVIGTLSVNF